MNGVKEKKKAEIYGAYVLEKTENLVIWRYCFEEDGREKYKTVKHTCRAIFFVIKPIVLWRPRCLNSLISCQAQGKKNVGTMFICVSGTRNPKRLWIVSVR